MGERDRLEGFIRKSKRFGFLPLSAPTAEEMAGQADDNLFKAVRSEGHVLHALLPPPRPHAYDLGPAHTTYYYQKKTKGILLRVCYIKIYI